MKRFYTRKAPGILIVLLFLFTAACSTKHYTIQRAENLSFYLEEDEAEKVFFASSLDQYQYHPAARLENGIWVIALPIHKEFEYFYLVDGVVTLPDCQLTVRDDFGSENCLFISNM